MLQDVMASFSQRLNDLFGGQISGLSDLNQQTAKSIQEAVGLILHTAAMDATQGHPTGKIFVLDMGHPITIAHLARQMVLLAGKGHESTQTTAQVVISLDDAALARQILGEIARD
jgi:hypothetical protein